MTCKVQRSRTGLPTMSERGGGMTHTGSCTIICGAKGEPLRPIFVPRGSCGGDHAIFVVKPGYYILDAWHDRDSEKVCAYKILAIGTEEGADFLQLEEVGAYENGDTDLPPFLNDAVKAATDKSHCYHCREPHYVNRD